MEDSIQLSRPEVTKETYRFGNQQLNVFEKDGQIFFDAEQSALGLGITQVKAGKTYVRWERVQRYLSSPQVGKGSYITEPQFYTLAIKADNQIARAFQNWVTSKVLPSIRKNGAYVTNKTAMKLVSDPSALGNFLENIGHQVNALLEDKKQLQKRIDYEHDDYIFGHALSGTDHNIHIRELAAILSQNNYSIGQNQLFELLRREGYLIAKGHDRNLPKRKATSLGLFYVRHSFDKQGNSHSTTWVTPKGQKYFINKALKGDFDEVYNQIMATGIR